MKILIRTIRVSILMPVLIILLLAGCGGGSGGGAEIVSDPVTSDPVVSTPTGELSLNLSHWFANGLTGKKICLVGDSTTSNATALFNEFNNFYTKEGEALYGVDSVLNFGENGASLLAFLSDIVSHGITATIAAQADLYIISYGINDVRLGQTTEDQLVSLLEQAVDDIRAGVPNADIVLRIPNSLLSSDVNGYGYVQPNSNSQFYSTLLRNAYLRLANHWDNVVVLDTQNLIFGIESLPSSIYMADQLHPSSAGYVAIAKALVDVIGQKQPYDSKLAIDAVAVNPLAPYSVYPRVVEDPDFYELVASGRWVASSTAGAPDGYVDFTWPQERSGEILCSDVVQMAVNHLFALPTTCGISQIGGHTRIYNLGGDLPPFTMTGGTVNVWRWK
jgi:lysophospholipase L1-like esterase